MISCRVCSPFRMSLPSPILYATDWSPAASYQTLDGTGRSLVASKVGGADMSTVTASIPTAYALSEREAINPWIIAVTVTLATFMELLDTAIAQHQRVDLTRRLRTALEQPHVTLWHQPIAQIYCAKKERFTRGIDDLFVISVRELRARRGNRCEKKKRQR